MHSLIKSQWNYCNSLCYGQNCVSPNSYIEVIPLVPQNVTVVGKRAFREVIKVKWGHVSGPYSSMTGVVIRRELRTQPRRGKAAWRQGEDGHLQAKERASGERVLPMPSSQTSSPQSCEEINFCCSSHSVHDTLLWQLSKLIQPLVWAPCFQSCPSHTNTSKSRIIHLNHSSDFVIYLFKTLRWHPTSHSSVFHTKFSGTLVL